MKDFNFFDIHSHINFKDFDADREQVISQMAELGMGTITVGTDYETSREAVELAGKYENLFACIGQHPADNILEKFDVEKYRELARNKKVVAIGECGLDYFRKNDEETKENQKKLFVAQINLARELDLPLMIHARPSKNSMDAYHDVIDILEQFENPSAFQAPPLGKGRKLMVNFHFYVGDLATTERILLHNWTMSFDGPITFASDYDEIIKRIPIENIMCETDAPFASPAPYRGQRNSPIYVKYIYEAIAEKKSISIEKLRQSINETIFKIFGI